MSGIDHSRQPVFTIDLNNRHQIEPEQSKVGEVVLCELFAEQMRMHAPKPAKAVLGHARTSKIRQLDLLCRADHYIFDLSLAIDKHADLAAGLVRDLGHLAGEFGRDDRIRRNAPRSQFLNASKLIMFETAGKTVNDVDRKEILRLG